MQTAPARAPLVMRRWVTRVGIRVGYEADNFFRWAESWLVCAGLLVVLIAGAEVGFRFAVRRRRAAKSDDTGGLGIVLGALLGLLSLLLGFTYSYVVIRSETRKTAVIDEANAIGTAYLRAELVPAPHGPELCMAIRHYLDTRIIDDEVGEDVDRLRQAVAYSEEVQSRIWPVLQRVLAGRTSTPADAVLIESLNAMIDMHTVRLAAGRDHVPAVVMWMLLFVSTAALLLCGVVAGVSGERHFGRNLVFALAIVVVMYIILDLDRPRGGLIRVSQQSLEDLRQSLGATPGAATAPATRSAAESSR
jgi:hypothetical protein